MKNSPESFSYQKKCSRRRFLAIIAAIFAGGIGGAGGKVAHRMGLGEIIGSENNNEGPIRCSLESIGDLHIHTENSYDVPSKELCSVERILEEAVAKKVDILAFTDHDFYHNFNTSQNLASKADIILIPAVEASGLITNSWERKIFGNRARAHVLAFGVTEPLSTPKECLRIEELIERVHEQNGLAFIAHPMATIGIDWLSKKGAILASEFDGIEGFNARMSHEMNKAARKLARELNRPITGGSDAIYAKNVGKGLTVFRPDAPIRDWQKCLELIENNQTSVRGEDLSLSSFFLQFLE